MRFLAADEDDKAVAGGDDIAFAEQGIVHRSVCGFRVLLFGLDRGSRLRAGIRDKLLRAATRLLNSLLPLFARERGIRKVVGFLGETALWRRHEASADQQRRDPNRYGETSGITRGFASCSLGHHGKNGAGKAPPEQDRIRSNHYRRLVFDSA
jgi:hypothetical protein